MVVSGVPLGSSSSSSAAGAAGARAGAAAGAPDFSAHSSQSSNGQPDGLAASLSEDLILEVLQSLDGEDAPLMGDSDAAKASGVCAPGAN